MDSLAGPLPHPVAPPPEGRRGYALLQHTGCADPLWHFRVGLPRDVQRAPSDGAAPSREGPRSIACFRRDNPPADVEVMGMALDCEIDPADWLDRYLEIEGMRAVSSRRVPTPGGEIGDTVATWARDGEAFAGRFFATKWGQRLFLLCQRTALEHYESLADDFFATIATFSAADLSRGRYAEPVSLVKGAVPASWLLFFPRSWVLTADRTGAGVASFQATQKPAAPAKPAPFSGKVSFAVADRALASSPRAAASAYLDAVRDAGVTLEHEDFAERAPAPTERAPARYEGSWRLVTRAAAGGRPAEVRCAVLLREGAWVVAGALGATREGGLLAWMRNKRALDLALSTLAFQV